MNNIMQFRTYFAFILVAALSYCGQLQAAGEQEIQASTSAEPKEPEGDLRESSSSTEQIYNSLRFAASMYSFELSSVWVTDPLKSKYKEICGSGSFDFYCETKNSKEVLRLKEILKSRAVLGDGVAMFYMGLLTADSAKGMDSTRDYEKAVAYYKQACNSGVAAGCWNVAIMYADGIGVFKSGLAAAEWFYKAGIGYLKIEERDRALSALESIQKIDRGHPLGIKLGVLLQKNMPN